MSKLLAFSILLLALPGAGWAQVDSARSERLNKDQAGKQADDDQQQRRAALRAALAQAREQKANQTDEETKVRRQLTAQERQELRLQLRQQRNKLNPTDDVNPR